MMKRDELFLPMMIKSYVHKRKKAEEQQGKKESKITGMAEEGFEGSGK